MAALIQNNQPSTSMEAEMVDRISDLPIPILHHILSFLPTRDVVRTCVLSKHWRSTSSSFPILEFDIYDFRSYRRGGYYNNPIKDEEFLRWVDARVERLCETTDTNILRLKVWVGLLDPRIIRAIERAMERNVEELDLAFLSLLGDDNIKHQHILYSARSVVVYKLEGINLSLPDLLRGCPLLQELHLRDCYLLQETNIVNDDANNLKTLVFKKCHGISDLVIRVPNLESFAYPGGFICAIHLDLAQTSSLKSVNLGDISISEEWLENLIRGCPKLEFLKLYCNYRWERIAICHQRLKTLKLYGCTINSPWSLIIKIDTPELLRFTYNGPTMPFYMFNYSASLKATLNLFRREKDDATWFANLRKMLQWFSGCVTLQLIIPSDVFYPEELIFGMDIRDNSIPLMYGLKNLEIQFPICRPTSHVPFIELIDTYLWLCPHLETLKITYEETEEVAMFKFEREHRNIPLCCAEHPGECWKFSGKKVTLASYVGRESDKQWLLSTCISHYGDTGRFVGPL